MMQKDIGGAPVRYYESIPLDSVKPLYRAPNFQRLLGCNRLALARLTHAVVLVFYPVLRAKNNMVYVDDQAKRNTVNSFPKP